MLLFAIFAGCTKPLDLEGRPCPCVLGYTCDPRCHICVLDDAVPDDAVRPDPRCDAGFDASTSSDAAVDAPPDASLACLGDQD